MTDEEMLAKMDAAHRAAREKSRRTREEVARRTGLLMPGDLFSWAGAAQLDIWWAPILPHQDDSDLVYVVPADTCSLDASTDVGIPTSAMSGPLTLRCGHGLWMDRLEIPTPRRVGILEEKHLRRARRVLSELAAGDLVGSPLQRDLEFDPEYQEWMAAVAAAAEEFADRSRLRRERLLAADYAEYVLGIFEAEHPGDNRPRAAVAVARLYALGLVGEWERNAAREAALEAALAADELAGRRHWAPAYAAYAAWQACLGTGAFAVDRVARDAASAAAAAAAMMEWQQRRNQLRAEHPMEAEQRSAVKLLEAPGPHRAALESHLVALDARMEKDSGV